MSESNNHRGSEFISPRGPENKPQSHQEHKQYSPEKAHHEHAEALGKIKLEIEQTAESGEELKKDLAAEAKQPDQPRFLNNELRQKALKDVLSRTRHHLNKPEKSLSKFIHRPLVEKISVVSASTIGRPSGLAAAGFVALLGGSLLLYLSNHYGYEYRFSAYGLLLGCGFVAGLLIELFVSVLRRGKNSS